MPLGSSLEKTHLYNSRKQLIRQADFLLLDFFNRKESAQFFLISQKQLED